MRRRIAILGSTGSIGTQALDVISQHPDMFEVELLTANGNWQQLAEQAIKFKANSVVICDQTKYQELFDTLDPHDIKVFAGAKSIAELVCGSNIDIVVTAMVDLAAYCPPLAQ